VELGDDRWTLPVSHCGKGSAGWAVRRRNWAGGLAGLRASAGGLLGCGARRVKRLGRLAQAGCCAGLLLGWARRWDRGIRFRN
jgi:hypothetical protein